MIHACSNKFGITEIAREKYVNLQVNSIDLSYNQQGPFHRFDPGMGSDRVRNSTQCDTQAKSLVP